MNTDSKNILNVAHDVFLARGGKVDKNSAKPAIDAWRKAHEAREKAAIALEKAKEAEYMATRKLVETIGKGRHRIDGVVYLTSCRGDSIFLRPEGGGDVTDFG